MNDKYLGRTKMISSDRTAAALVGAAVFIAVNGPAAAEVPAMRVPLDLRVGTSSPAIVDLDEDGYSDIVIVSMLVEEGGDTSAGSAGAGLDGDDESGGEIGVDLEGDAPCGEPGLTPPEPSCGASLEVHVIDGASGYTAELSGWPRTIQSCISSVQLLTPTVAIGDIDFDGTNDVLVGGLMNDSTRDVMAFRPDGTDVPGWEAVDSAAAPFFNAVAFGDVNVDGSPDLVVADESTYLQRFGALGRNHQIQFIGDPVLSSPAIGDLGSPGGVRVADGLPDAVATATVDLPGAWDSLGLHRDFGSGDLLFRVGDLEHNGGVSSSPAIGDLDGDGTPELVVGRGYQNALLVFDSTSADPNDPATVNEYALPRGSWWYPVVYHDQYSSPAIVDLDGDAQRRELLVGADGGQLFALRYDADLPRRDRLVDDLDGWAGGVVLGDGYPVSSSPVAADLVGDARPEVAVGTDEGSVFVLGSNGTLLGEFTMLDDATAGDPDAAILGGPAIGSRTTNSSPIIVAANRKGLFVVSLDSFPALSSRAPAQWPTFHGDNARTGALPMPVDPIVGSIGGIASTCADLATIELLHADGTPVVDPGEPGTALTAIPTAEGRFVFETLEPGSYLLFSPYTDGDVEVTVTAGDRFDVQLGTADVNLDGVINSQDFFDFLTGLFNGTEDFNGDGVTNSQDYFDFLTAFFLAC